MNARLLSRSTRASALLLLAAGSSTGVAAEIEEIIVTAQHREQDLQDVPAAVSALSGEQVVKQGKFGETYHPEDGRELKDKLIKILTNYPNYLEELNGVELELQEQHHFERYAEELYAHYEKLYSQRLRYTQKKKKLA